jgi:hypothetical protein
MKEIIFLNNYPQAIGALVDKPPGFEYPFPVRVGPARRSPANPVRSERKQR